MAKISNISGFPEWTPEQKLVEERIIGNLRSIYESHGFTPIETPAAELISTLTAQGVVDKEIYALRRLQAEDDEKSELGLHFDLTVPFARYVAQHLNDLVFPFKRYQIQKVWRGERPQKGRFREFYQFDVDIAVRDSLPLACDAEVLTISDKSMQALGLGAYSIRINNRKILLGLYSSLGLSPEQQQKAIVAVDKIDKIGADGVRSELSGTVGVSEEVAEKIVEFAGIRVGAESLVTEMKKIGVDHELFVAGTKELTEILSLLPSGTRERTTVDLSLARGLAYYTGLIYEITLDDHLDFGSVCGGGRYEGLVSQFGNQNIPGVGGSLGLTRLMDLIIRNKLLPFDRKTPAQVLVAVYNEEQRPRCNEIAEEIRRCGVSAEVFFKAPKLGKQIDHAAKKGISTVVFLDSETSQLSAKDIVSGEQAEVSDIVSWCEGIKSPAA